ncbi:MAG: hypothetical protein ACI35S_00600 [Anaeroplasma sp.]
MKVSSLTKNRIIMEKELKQYYIIRFDKRGIEPQCVLDRFMCESEKEAKERFESVMGPEYYHFELRRILKFNEHLLILEKNGKKYYSC